MTFVEYFLDNNECPLQRERQWLDPDHCRFELRWKNERLIEWKNSSTSIAQDIVNEQVPEYRIIQYFVITQLLLRFLKI